MSAQSLSTVSNDNKQKCECSSAVQCCSNTQLIFHSEISATDHWFHTCDYGCFCSECIDPCKPHSGDMDSHRNFCIQAAMCKCTIIQVVCVCMYVYIFCTLTLSRHPSIAVGKYFPQHSATMARFKMTPIPCIQPLR